MNMKNIGLQVVQGVEGYEKDGVVYLRLESVAYGLGFTRTANSGHEVVRWDRVCRYLCDFGIVPTSGNGRESSYQAKCPEYIPENIFYRLAMKAKNEVAEAFQAKVADEIIPTLRRTGSYSVNRPSYMIEDAIERAKAWIKEEEERRVLSAENTHLNSMLAVKDTQISEMRPKASYYDVVLACKDLLPISVIAKDYGWSAVRMNEWLHRQGIQYLCNDTWLLYQKYAEQGYTRTKTHIYSDKSGMSHTKVHTYWTQRGRLFLYEQLKADGKLPLVER